MINVSIPRLSIEKVENGYLVDVFETDPKKGAKHTHHVALNLNALCKLIKELETPLPDETSLTM